MEEYSQMQIIDAINRWHRHPHDSIVVESEKFYLSIDPRGQEWNRVEYTASDDTLSLIAEVEGIILSHGRSSVTWQIKPGCTPVGLAAELLERGYTRGEQLDYLYFDMGDAGEPVLPNLRQAAGASVRRVWQLRDAEEFESVQLQSFEHMPPQQGDPVSRARDMLREIRRTGRVAMLARIEGHPVSAADGAVEGAFLKLFGGCTLPSYRSRGLYGSVTVARCREGFRKGARYVLVTAVSSTSSPTLVKAGFTKIGEEVRYEGRVTKLED